jgi:hypothetical protein
MTAYNLYFIYMYFVGFLIISIDCLLVFATSFVGRIFHDRIMLFAHFNKHKIFKTNELW